MMYIVRKSDRDAAKRTAKELGYSIEENSFNWHVGSCRPTAGGQSLDDVCEVYADGQELEYVRKKHTNLPDCPDARGVTWSGDFARFIYDHLPVSRRQVDETAHYR